MDRTAQAKTEQEKTRIRTGFDYTLLAIVLVLVSFGLVMLYSTSYYSAEQKFGNGMYFFTRQAVISVFGFIFMMLASKISYHLYIRLSPLLLAFSWILMAMVRFTPLGIESYGAKRWLYVPVIGSVQPSEIAKIAVILFLPFWIMKVGKKFNKKFFGWFSTFAWGAVTAFLTYYLTDHLSAALIILGVTYILIYVANRHSKFLALFGIFIVTAGYIGARLLARVLESSDSFRLARLIAWYDPEKHVQSGGYQILQGLYAIGAGGFFGKGLGNSSQKLGFIPEAQNDMILTIIGEELGVCGILFLLFLFALLFYRLVHIARNAPDLSGALVVSGVFAHIALQVLLNICVILNVVPTTGITLPFISYGGSAIVFLMFEIALALSVSDRTKRKLLREAAAESA